jgi:hypothetical protein
MNNRIEELAEQAWRATFDEVAHLNRIHNRSYSQDDITDIFEIKFAELIVRECIEIVDKVYDEQTGKGGKLCSRDTPYQEIINEIEDHFGVEE